MSPRSRGRSVRGTIGIGLVVVVLLGADARGEVQPNSAVQLDVLVHLQRIGDRSFSSGQWAGTRGEERQLEGFQVRVRDAQGLGVECMAHLQGLGDTRWASGYVGTRGQNRRLEGFACRLTGAEAGFYDIRYRAHLENIGDTEPFTNGAFCGTRGQSRRVESIQLWIERRAEPRSDVALDLMVHSQGTNGRTVSAGQWGDTRVEGGRLEGFQVRIRNVQALGVECMAHYLGSGDIAWTNGFVGTRGHARRLGGFACRLTGARSEGFHIRYRGRIQGDGTTRPAADGAFCGSRSPSRPLEAIQLWVVRRRAP